MAAASAASAATTAGFPRRPRPWSRRLVGPGATVAPGREEAPEMSDPERQRALAGEAYQAATEALQWAAWRYAVCELLQIPTRESSAWAELSRAAEAFSNFKRAYEQHEAAAPAAPRRGRRSR